MIGWLPTLHPHSEAVCLERSTCRRAECYCTKRVRMPMPKLGVVHAGEEHDFSSYEPLIVLSVRTDAQDYPIGLDQRECPSYLTQVGQTKKYVSSFLMVG